MTPDEEREIYDGLTVDEVVELFTLLDELEEQDN